MVRPMAKRCVELSEELVKRIESVLDKAGFKSVEEFIEFVVSEALEAVAGPGEASMSKEDEEKVKERLRALGYI